MMQLQTVPVEIYQERRALRLDLPDSPVACVQQQASFSMWRGFAQVKVKVGVVTPMLSPLCT
eukprot:1136348-Pelagomonas_calceolata.AAC.6